MAEEKLPRTRGAVVPNKLGYGPLLAPNPTADWVSPPTTTRWWSTGGAMPVPSNGLPVPGNGLPVPNNGGALTWQWLCPYQAMADCAFSIRKTLQINR
ncbi:unnamed protein product [Lasius platythorax]|uniref:Uncharacterized protein n=1 Tax=Lasius platythorax TaxID=488582 RepID=A0AAV2NK53_9HYME